MIFKHFEQHKHCFQMQQLWPLHWSQNGWLLRLIDETKPNILHISTVSHFQNLPKRKLFPVSCITDWQTNQCFRLNNILDIALYLNYMIINASPTFICIYPCAITFSKHILVWIYTSFSMFWSLSHYWFLTWAFPLVLNIPCVLCILKRYSKRPYMWSQSRRLGTLIEGTQVNG